MAKQRYSIFIIDDDPLVNSTISGVLSTVYSSIISFTNAEKALAEIETLCPDLVLLDIFLGEANGLEVLRIIRERGLDMPVIMMTAFSDVRMAVDAIKLGAEDYIVKPLDLDQLELSVQKSLKNYDLRRQVLLLKEQLPQESEFIGQSPSVKKLLQLANTFAHADDTTVLILGESGTGKEVIAKHIHKHSPRASGPLVTVNCGAIPKELAESELFGHERGAFTGADKMKPGKFELAQHGTLFLDEIGELPLDLQVKLLRVLQEKTFYRLSGTKEITADVRIIAATNRRLEDLISEGKFREDLYYRLNVATLNLPPLRDRVQDIPLLATTFVQEFATKFRKTIVGFSPEAMAILQQSWWKGNVRELRNAMERAVLMEQDTLICEDTLDFLQPRSASQVQTTVKQTDLPQGHHVLRIARLGVPMANVTRDLIEQTLAITEGNQVQAAKILGITRAKLRYRIEQLSIKV
jgi:DNA-binding NtrC family response regulator